MIAIQFVDLDNHFFKRRSLRISNTRISNKCYLFRHAQMKGIESSLVGRIKVAASIGFLVFFSSCVLLIISVLLSPSHSVLPADILMVGQNTALATAMIGMAMMFSGRPDTVPGVQVLYLFVVGLSGLVLLQWVLNSYPHDSSLRFFINTLPVPGSWPGRMSHVTAAALFLLAISALLVRRQTGISMALGATGSGFVTAVALGSFAAHLTGLTLFPSGSRGDGTLSLTTSFLLTLIGMAHGYQILSSKIFSDWQSSHPGQSIFVEVMILLSLLCVLALGFAGEFVVHGRFDIALGILLCFFFLGLSVIYRPIVMLVNNVVATGEELRVREAALEQAQSQARLGSWRILLDSGELEWSQECYRIFGFSPETPITFDDFVAAVHPADREHVRQSWRLALSGAEYDIEHRIVVNSEVKWVRERARLEFDMSNSLLSGIGTVQDITQLKRKEAQLRESRDQVRELAAHNEEIRENERARIARELHDEMGQQLTVLRLDASLIKKHVGHVSPELEELLVNMKNGIDASISVMRDVAAALRPLALDAGLVSAADWLLDNVQQRTGMQCDLIVDGSDAQLDAGRSTTAFRVLQESLTNVIRHANATQLSVRITSNDRELFLSVTDNGVGFDPAKVGSFRRFGLMGIRERVLIYGGTTTIDSEAGRGTTLSVIIPLEPGAEKGTIH